jgi:hypothetical protein
MVVAPRHIFDDTAITANFDAGSGVSRDSSGLLDRRARYEWAFGQNIHAARL